PDLVRRDFQGSGRCQLSDYRPSRTAGHHRSWRCAQARKTALPGCLQWQAGYHPARVPTSAMFTFHDMVVPILRRMAGLPPRVDAQTRAQLPFRVPSELGRTEFVMVSLVQGREGLTAYATGKGSGAITA